MHIKLYNTRKTSRAAGIWKICCWIHILAWINHSCIVINKLLVLDGSLHYVQCVPHAQILQIFLLFSMIWYCRIQLRVFSKQRTMMRLSIGYVCNSSIDRVSRLLHAHIAYEMDTAKIIAAFLRIFYWLHDFIRLNSIVCHVQTTMIRFSLIDFEINWLCLKCLYWQGYLD